MGSIFGGGDKSEQATQPLSKYLDTEPAELAPEPADLIERAKKSPPAAKAGGPSTTTPAPLVAESESLDKHLAAIASRVRAAKKKAAAAILSIGKELAEAQELLATPGSGSFVKFVRQRCGLSTSSAYRAIDAYKQFGDDATIAKRIEPAALHVLAKAPAAAVAEARSLMAEGETITKQTAARIVRDHKPKPAASSKPAPVILEAPDGSKVVIHKKHDFSSIEQILAGVLRGLVNKEAA